MTVKKGIDVSSYNSGLDYPAISREINFAVLRAGFTGYGTGRALNKDKLFETHYANFTKQKVPLGVYYYSCADSEPEAIREAKYLLTLLEGKKFSYPVFMDVEDSYHQQKLSKEALTKVVLAFCRVLEKAGYYVGVYANAYWWKNELDMEALKSLDRWVAHYGVMTPGVPGDMWQHTETGKLPGYSGKLDLNWCYKDYPAIIQKAGLNGYEAANKTSKIIVKGEMGVEHEAKVTLAKQLLSALGFVVSIEVS